MKYWEERREARDDKNDGRSAYEVDFARIMHSSSFRRLSGKTQIHHDSGDFVRTRLTHSLEVSQLALGIAQRLRVKYPEDSHLAELLRSDALLQTLGLIHDLGHPPGGHAGEEALNAMMFDAGGFEGNGQTLRIIAKLESNTVSHGANLTRRTMLGTLKYPVPYSSQITDQGNPPRSGLSGKRLIGKEHAPPKCYLDTEADVVDWLFTPISQASEIMLKKIKSFDCQLLDMADDLAYSVADCEDAIALGMLDQDSFSTMTKSMDWIARQTGKSVDELINDLCGSSSSRKRATGLMINTLLGRMKCQVSATMDDLLYNRELTWGQESGRFIRDLKTLVYEKVIRDPRVQYDRMKLQGKIIEVFDAFTYRPTAYLPEEQKVLWQEAGDESSRKRVVCDYIAGMTDRYLTKIHERMIA